MGLIRIVAFIAFVGTCFAFQHPASAKDLPGNLEEGMQYPQARVALINGGWKPVHFPEGHCVGRSDVCAAYPETDDCAGTGLGQCRFVFSDGKGSSLIVITAGEDPLLVDSSHIEQENAPDEVVQVEYVGPINLSDFTCLPTSDESSFINRICFQDTRFSRQFMLLQLRSKWYQYCNIDENTLVRFLRSSSLGKFYNANIKGKFGCVAD